MCISRDPYRKKLVRWARPFGVGVVDHLKHALPSPHAEFGRSVSNGVDIIGRTYNVGERWGPVFWDGAWLTFKNTPLLTCVTTPNLVVLRQMIWDTLKLGRAGMRGMPDTLHIGVSKCGLSCRI